MNASVKIQRLNAIPTTLKETYPKAQKNRLRFKKPQKRGGDFFTLPFVGKDHGQFSYWDVPLTTDFLVGTYLGSALAGIYLNYIQRSENVIKHCLLGDIAEAWAEKSRSCTQSELEGLRGQIKGFIGKVNPCQIETSWPGAAEANAPRSDGQWLAEANRWLALGSDDALLALVKASEKPAKE
ncbi:hypothetical protein SAMN05216189_104716 [Pseudomonas delhiensis]|uniref:Uncharacterized protein n=1 Tax=Pseudomonas delhiensis TaxID=366289 RepID=A0A239NCZ7_9PSED|nr:hypothetical protein [Pseudomonas delhiensis]SDK68056.1 hypothetical protein SAMN05216189_104716 [Pseudomonas delhiensis]SNT52630.1 hypothetical protein SAMN06295949_14216 [Pseudomonas delhiensis]